MTRPHGSRERVEPVSTSARMAVVLDGLRPRGGTELIGGDPAACAEALGVDGLAVSLVCDGGVGEPVWATPGPSLRLEDLQFTLGQGPGADTLDSAGHVLEPDLDRVDPDRWPALLPELRALRVRAVFCFPLLVGRVRLGVLTLHRRTPGPLTDTAMDDALILVGALVSMVLDNAVGDTATREGPSVLYRAAVHQATGMVSVQAGVPLPQAMLLLRAHAYRCGRPVLEVADDVVARRLHFRDSGAQPDAFGGKGR
ncbi:GAF domain-containing protein [Streptomyces ruber]|uniref:GAF domain-containing protein n=2 Tax=Streptomyces TaxID=1883 RepID=A0A918BGV2_9ACTN|nr:GAF and ANTAR domain-containing protein [Streptomyces ruber]GGQ64533.1 GAF domain-containing protein [Streptomyces ruber]